jgi:DNA repair protein RadC
MNKISEIKVSYTPVKMLHAKLKDSRFVYEILLSKWSDKIIELQEEFKILYLNNANEILGIYPMSKGGVSGTVVDVRLIFSVALKCNASAIILAHNHPSGNLKPSESDKVLTRKIKQASDFLDVKLLDHLIISKASYYSFADEGIL